MTNRRLKFLDFITKAGNKFNNKFIYIEESFCGLNRPVTIICPTCGKFNQVARQHLKSIHGCRKCFEVSITKSHTMFLKEVSIKYPNFNFTDSVYKNSHSIISFSCQKCGGYSKTTANNLITKDTKCPWCETTHYKFNQETFIKKAFQMYGVLYNYNTSSYKGIFKFISVKCNRCGNNFYQTPSNLLDGHGCPSCRGGVKLNTNEFIKRAEKKHKNKYIYPPMVYYNIRSPVNILCPIHGLFKKIGEMHLRGVGCPGCSTGGFRLDEPALLYYIKDTVTGFYKIGITNRTIKDRFGKRMSRLKVVAIWYLTMGVKASRMEKVILKEFSASRVNNKDFGDGSTEFFNNDILQLDGLLLPAP